MYPKIMSRGLFPPHFGLSITLVEVNLGHQSIKVFFQNICGSSLYFFANCNLSFNSYYWWVVCILWYSFYIAALQVFSERLIEMHSLLPCGDCLWCHWLMLFFTALAMFLSSTAVLFLDLAVTILWGDCICWSHWLTHFTVKAEQEIRSWFLT